MSSLRLILWHTLKLPDPFDEGEGGIGFDEDLDDDRAISGLSADCLEEARRAETTEDMSEHSERRLILPCLVVDISQLGGIGIERGGC